jgi:hypothetical protein
MFLKKEPLYRNVPKIKQARRFILLEILIGIAILAFILPFVMDTPFILFREQWRLLERSELQRLSDACYAETKVAFYRNEVKKSLFSPSSYSLWKTKKQRCFFGGRTYEERCFLRTLSLKDTGSEEYRIVLLKIQYTHLKEKICFFYRIPLFIPNVIQNKSEIGKIEAFQ